MLWKRTNQEQTKKTCREENTKENPRTVHFEYKAVVHGFKDDSKEEDVKAAVENSIKATGMKDVEYTIDCPAIPITHVFVEFQNTKIRDRYFRSASMQKVELNGRTMRISHVLSAEERFHRKRMRYVKCAIVKVKGIALHHIKLNLEMKTITIN